MKSYPAFPRTATMAAAALLVITLSQQALSTTPPAPPASPAVLKDITASAPAGRKSLIRITLTADVTQLVLQKKDDYTAQIRMRPVAADKSALNSAVLKPGITSVLAHIERTDVLVANVRFSSRVASVVVQSRAGGKIEVLVRLDDTTAPAPPAGTDTRADKPVKKDTATGTMKAPTAYRRLRPTVIIDAGHGGTDPGAIGVGGLREKNVTLAVARKLRQQLKAAMPKCRVIMTRNSDVFISLDQRRRIAQRNKTATLFVSLHCNSTPEKPTAASGCECYVLRTKDNEDLALGLAVEEVEPVFKLGIAFFGSAPPPSGAKYAGKSRRLASIICSQMSKTSAIQDRGVKRAGFYVLAETPMPSVLVEIGYITNPKEAAILKSSSGQARIADGVLAGIGRYLTKN